LNLSIDIDEDRQFTVNRINFNGNTTTRDEVIRREILIKEGQVFNSSLWELPEWGYGYTAALINFAFLAHGVLSTDETLKAMS
jgi:hypothetical protein